MTQNQYCYRLAASQNGVLSVGNGLCTLKYPPDLNTDLTPRTFPSICPTTHQTPVSLKSLRLPGQLKFPTAIWLRCIPRMNWNHTWSASTNISAVAPSSRRNMWLSKWTLYMSPSLVFYLGIVRRFHPTSSDGFNQDPNEWSPPAVPREEYAFVYAPTTYTLVKTVNNWKAFKGINSKTETEGYDDWNAQVPHIESWPWVVEHVYDRSFSIDDDLVLRFQILQGAPESKSSFFKFPTLRSKSFVEIAFHGHLPLARCHSGPTQPNRRDLQCRMPKSWSLAIWETVEEQPSWRNEHQRRSPAPHDTRFSPGTNQSRNRTRAIRVQDPHNMTSSYMDLSHPLVPLGPITFVIFGLSHCFKLDGSQEANLDLMFTPGVYRVDGGLFNASRVGSRVMQYALRAKLDKN
ncbi:hypothetical protein B0H11DRAFT_1914481 [Mycena galericulata]|nr:hypothetical protein B0H11DRAFT_1914481 [Mycena galericulata]